MWCLFDETLQPSLKDTERHKWLDYVCWNTMHVSESLRLSPLAFLYTQSMKKWKYEKMNGKVIISFKKTENNLLRKQLKKYFLVNQIEPILALLWWRMMEARKNL